MMKMALTAATIVRTCNKAGRIQSSSSSISVISRVLSIHHHHHDHSQHQQQWRSNSNSTSYSCNKDNIKLGLGAHKYARMLPNQYSLVVQTAVDHGVTTIECPNTTDLANVVIGDPENGPITVLQRVGYRTIETSSDDTTSTPSSTATSTNCNQRISGDLLLEELQTKGETDTTTTTTTQQVVHNLSVSHMHQIADSSSSTTQLLANNPHIQLIPMVHNPEVHGNSTADRLTEAFCGLEEIVKQSNNRIPSFGVVSNGLALPKDHPLHLDVAVVLNAADRAAKELGLEQSSLSILQLPINVMEVRGIQVARAVKALRPHIQLYAMRPLTYYPDFGTGTGQSISLLDYCLPQGPDQQDWTHLMAGPPPFYQKVLNIALSHFDGEALLEAKQERNLTDEEAETLEGAKYLQSLLHELDAEIANVISFSAYEEHVMNVVIPALFGTFEELDEPSTHILSNFFAAHGWTIRHALATRTRKMLQNSEHDIPSNVKLQEFALEFLFKENSIDKVIMGATQPEQILDAVGVWNKISS